MSNAAEVVAQMAAHGLPPLPPNHPILDGKYKRFGPQKKAWYILREMTLRSGRTVVTGAFGFFQGENRNTVPVTVDMEEMSDDDRAEYSRQQRAAEQAEAKRREDEIRLAANRARDQLRKAAGDPAVHPYLVRKQVAPEGLSVSIDGKLLIPLLRGGQLMGLQKIDAAGEKKLNAGMDAVGVSHMLGNYPVGAPVIALGEGYATCASARQSVRGDYDLPTAMALNAGNLIVVAKSLRRDYPNAHLLLLADDDYLLVERFAERLLEDFNVSVAVPIDGSTHQVCADDGELVSVTAWWREDAQGIPYIEADMRRGRLVRNPTFKNAGVSSCFAAAAAVGNASVCIPRFGDRAGRKLTDFNDLQAESGVEEVRRQVLSYIHAAQQRLQGVPAPAGAGMSEVAPDEPVDALPESGEHPPFPLAAEQRMMMTPAEPGALAPPEGGSDTGFPPAPLAAEQPPEGDDADDISRVVDIPSAEIIHFPAGGSPSAQGAGEGDEKKQGKKKPKKEYGREHWKAVDDVLENFILIYGEDMVWDCRHRMLMKLSAMRTIVQDSDVMKFWRDPSRKWVLKKNIVFDPRETPSPATSGPTATVNLFSGWKMKPKKGNCLQILTLLSHLCDGNEELETWIARWLAYPLRHPGAKMETSIIMHGDEGSGKNFFFEKVVKTIYGEYGYTIGNAQLESNFNDWASMKLFMVADEVVTRAELKQMKGKLKYLISGDSIIINPKGMPEHSEANQMNFVFLSNELQPLALDKTDRRYLVIWTPPALGKEFYVSVAEEIAAGGIEAFYHYLMYELDMGDFNEHTKPIYNEAKDKLIEKSLAPAERFFREWEQGLLPLPFITCAVTQLYEAFQTWCGRSGESRYTSMTLFSPQIERYAGGKMRKHPIIYEFGAKVKQRIVFLVGDQPAGKTLREWAEGACNVFETDLNAYRHRNNPDMGG